MTIIETKVYSAAELKAEFPEAFERALQNYVDHNDEIFWQAEIIESFKAIFKAAGLKLKDWNIGAYSYSDCRAGFNSDEVAELTGGRAMAWLENNLLAPLRLPWTGARRWTMAKHNLAYVGCGDCRPYSAGLVPPCPFTGYCADEDFVSALRVAVKSGSSLKDAFESLADTARELLESEVEYQNSEEYFLDHASANEYQFEESGVRFN